MKRFIRILGITFWLSVFFLKASLIKAICKDPVKQRKRLALNTAFTSRRMLRLFGLKVRVPGRQNLKALLQENHLIVSNHVSYIDILVLSSVHPFIFITSLEMAANPVLGDITRSGGSLFTNRKKYTSLPLEINNFSAALTQGFDLMLFPEGTSTNGETIREFRKSLFQTSINAQKPILPICVKYKTLDGKPIESQAQRDIVCWYGEMTFVPHFWQILGHQIEAEVTVLESIPFDPSLNRQQLCDIVYKELLAVYHAYQNSKM
jgi:1-acyl-sn-glycerol-3-phosphate acyltransferase